VFAVMNSEERARVERLFAERRRWRRDPGQLHEICVNDCGAGADFEPGLCEGCSAFRVSPGAPTWRLIQAFAAYGCRGRAFEEHDPVEFWGSRGAPACPCVAFGVHCVNCSEAAQGGAPCPASRVYVALRGRLGSAGALCDLLLSAWQRRREGWE